MADCTVQRNNICHPTWSSQCDSDIPPIKRWESMFSLKSRQAMMLCDFETRS